MITTTELDQLHSTAVRAVEVADKAAGMPWQQDLSDYAGVALSNYQTAKNQAAIERVYRANGEG